jgi:hypothetical protein
MMDNHLTGDGFQSVVDRLNACGKVGSAVTQGNLPGLCPMVSGRGRRAPIGIMIFKAVVHSYGQRPVLDEGRIGGEAGRHPMGLRVFPSVE